DEGLFLPIAVGRFGLHRPPGSVLWSQVSVLASGGDTARARVRVWGEDGAPVAELQDVVLKRVSRDALQRLGERWLDEALYETAWPGGPRAPAGAPAAPGVAALCAPAMDALDGLRRGARLDDYDTFIPQLEALCAQYVRQTFARLGWAPAAGEAV